MLARPAAVAAVPLADRLTSRSVNGGAAPRVVAGRGLRCERLARGFDRSKAMFAPSLRHARVAVPTPALEDRLAAHRARDQRARPRFDGWRLRDTRAQRRVGNAAACACGEARPFALIRGRLPPICFRCERLAHGREPYDLNHVFGKRNSPLTIRYPVNDHRAVFNVKQLDWTPESLENPNGDPLLEALARFHGLDNNVVHMLADCIAFAPKLKRVQDLLVTVSGPNWREKLEAAAARKRAAAAKRGQSGR